MEFGVRPAAELPFHRPARKVRSRHNGKDSGGIADGGRDTGTPYKAPVEYCKFERFGIGVSPN